MGDDVCWLDRVCMSCGRFLEADDSDEPCCPHCGAERVTAPAVGEPARDD